MKANTVLKKHSYKALSKFSAVIRGLRENLATKYKENAWRDGLQKLGQSKDGQKDEVAEKASLEDATEERMLQTKDSNVNHHDYRKEEPRKEGFHTFIAPMAYVFENSNSRTRGEMENPGYLALKVAALESETKEGVNEMSHEQKDLPRIEFIAEKVAQSGFASNFLDRLCDFEQSIQHKLTEMLGMAGEDALDSTKKAAENDTEIDGGIYEFTDERLCQVWLSYEDS